MTTASTASPDEILAAVAAVNPAAAADVPQKADLKQLQKGEAACPHCRSTEPWNNASWCPRCGYYPAFGTAVAPAESVAAWEEPQPDDHPAASLWAAIPNWAWVLIGGVAAIVGVSFYIRMVLDGSGHLGTLVLAGSQFVCLLVQVLVFLAAASSSDKFGPFDIFMKPVEIWKPTIARLPDSAWRLWLFAWAQTAGLCALFVIGGISFSNLFDDWGVKKRAAPNLVKAIADQARKDRGGDGSLEESMKSFAGAGDGEDQKKNKEQHKPVPRLSAECLIIGYIPGNAGFELLILATSVKNEIAYVGTVRSDTVSEADRAELNRRLPRLHASRPLVNSRIAGTWLLPKLVCEVDFKEWTGESLLKDARFQRLLNDIDVD